MSENRKVKNATPTEEAGIQFKSKFEARTYEELMNNGFEPKYEEICFNLAEPFYPSACCYDRHYDRTLRKKTFGLNLAKVLAITYTPDFTFAYKDRLIVIECKGKENDVFPLKKKLFRKWIESYHLLTGVEILYFEIHSLKELKESMDIIRALPSQE